MSCLCSASSSRQNRWKCSYSCILTDGSPTGGHCPRSCQHQCRNKPLAYTQQGHKDMESAAYSLTFYSKLSVAIQKSQRTHGQSHKWQGNNESCNILCKATNDRKIMNYVIFYAVSSLPVFCHRAQGIAFTDGFHYKHENTAWNIPYMAKHGKEVEQFYIILNFLTCGSTIRRGARSPSLSMTIRSE